MMRTASCFRLAGALACAALANMFALDGPAGANDYHEDTHLAWSSPIGVLE